MNTIFLHKLSIPWSLCPLQVQAGRTALFVVALWKNRVKNGVGEPGMGWVKPAPPKVGLRDSARGQCGSFEGLPGL